VRSLEVTPESGFSDLVRYSLYNPAQARKRSPPCDTSDESESSDSDDDDDQPERVDGRSFRVNDREGVLKYLNFRLSEFPGVLLKDVVNKWVKLNNEWKGFQKGGERQDAPASWPEGVGFQGVHRLKKQGKSMKSSTRASC
jgi:hypothetical protein